VFTTNTEESNNFRLRILFVTPVHHEKKPKGYEQNVAYTKIQFDSAFPNNKKWWDALVEKVPGIQNATIVDKKNKHLYIYDWVSTE
jgi:hypothetical protein